MKFLASGLLLVVLILAGLMFKDPVEFLSRVFEIQLRLKGVQNESYGNLRALRGGTCAGDDCKCVLLIHGLGDQAITWRNILKSARRFEGARFVAVDLPGSGRSSSLEDGSGYRVTRLAQNLSERILTTCSRWSVVGNSFGGWVALHLALNQPERVESLLLVGSAGLRGDYSHIYPVFLHPSRETLKAFARLSYDKPKAWLPDVFFDRLADRLHRLPVPQILGAQSESDFVDERLSQVRMPVHILWGASDRIIPVEHAERLARALPQATLDVRPGCGHLPQVECPEALLSHLQELLRTGT